MNEWFEISKIGLGIDLATSAALVASAAGVLWRVTVLSRKLQEKQIEAQKEDAQKIITTQREKARINFLLSINDELNEHILKLTRVFTDPTTTAEGGQRDGVDEEIKATIKNCWHWMQEKESRFIAIGTEEQINKLRRAQRHFLGSVDVPGQHSTHINPREMVIALRRLQKEILIDTRTYLFSETHDKAASFIDKSLDI